MKQLGLTVVVAALAAGVSNADTITQTVAFDYSPIEDPAFPVIQGFDTQGGALRLKNVTFEFRHNFTLDMHLESTGPTAVSEGDYGIYLAYMTIFQLGLADDETSPPFLGPGAFFVDNFSADLAAFDGVLGDSGPDTHTASFSDAYTHTQSYNHRDPQILNAVTDVGSLATVYGGFGELGLYWNNDPGWPYPPDGVPSYPDDAAIWVTLANFRHWGEIVITYEYGPVPAPSTLAPLAGLTLVARRRR